MKRQPGDRQRLVLGVTGNFGSGKSTVAGIFKHLGAEVIDADKIAHRIILPGSRVYKKIVSSFGSQILKKNKEIDRKILADIVFVNKALLQRLNRITHPEVIRIIKKKIIASKRRIVVLDVPLLIEAGLLDLVDKLIVVEASRKQQIARVIKKRPLSKSDIMKRLERQLPLKEKVRMADFVIDNSGTIERTKKQVENLRRRLWKN